MKCKKEDAMQIPQYIFKSPYSSPIQVGQLDPSSVKEDTSSAQTFTAPNETVQKAQSLQQEQKQSVTPTVSANTIDIYA